MEVDAMTKCKGWYTKALNASERHDVNDFLNYTLMIYNGQSNINYYHCSYLYRTQDIH